MEHHALFICTSCAFSTTQRDHLGHRGGHHLCQQLQQLQQQGQLPPEVTLEPVDCLSACHRFCAIALAAPQKTTLMFGDLPPLESAAAIAQLAAQYMASPNGLVPRQARPEPLQKGILARIPPWPCP